MAVTQKGSKKKAIEFKYLNMGDTFTLPNDRGDIGVVVPLSRTVDLGWQFNCIDITNGHTEIIDEDEIVIPIDVTFEIK